MKFSSQLVDENGKWRHRARDASFWSGSRIGKRFDRWLQGAFLVLLALSLFPVSPARAADNRSLIGINDQSSDYRFESPITDGQYVVWREQGLLPGSTHSRLHVAPLTGGEATSLGTWGNRRPRTAAIDGGYVAAATASDECGNDGSNGSISVVCLIDLGSGDQRVLADNLITPGESTIYAVAIDYPHVAWAVVDEAGETPQMTISAMNVESDEAATLVASEDIVPEVNVFLFVDGDNVRWATTYATREGIAGQARIGEPPTYFMSLHDTIVVDIEGDVMVTVTQGRPLFHNLATGEQLWLDEAEHNMPVATDGRYIFWSKTYEGARTLFGFDTETNARFTVWAVPTEEAGVYGRVQQIDTRDGAVVWSYYYFNEWMSAVHGTMISDRLPSAHLPDSGLTSPIRTYYPETGHYLANDFRDFWENNGGLHVFGYPLTEEFDYLSPETGNVHAAQMTERQRFEWHPENIGTPYTVQLGRLGETILQQQGRDWTTFEKADPSADHYFAETGHAIAPEFYAYWTTRGLDLGHPGTSFEESVALFGYPLSEPMMETNADGDTVLTQYFERAVFEYHPDQAEWNPVLLRRLGAELMDSWDW